MNKKEIDYMHWLHDVTVKLYDYDIVIRNDMGDTMKQLYDKGLSVEAAKEAVIQLSQNGSL